MFLTRLAARAIRRTRRFLSLAAVLCAAAIAAAGPASFTYQALITGNSGQPATSANATVKLDFFTAATGGTAVKTVTFTGQNLGATGGYVNLEVPSAGLDFAQPLWVEVTITDVAGGGSPEVLSPRQTVTSVPFSLSADTAFANRTLFVKPTGTQSPNPTGSASDPFLSINDAYAKAKTMGPSFINRVVIMLMPGDHVVTQTIVMDTQGIDLIGFGERSAAISGSVDPLINATATGNTGATIRNLLIQASAAPAVRALVIRDGRVKNVNVGRPGAALTSTTLVEINAVSGVAFNDFEIQDNVTILWYGAQTSFTNGYINGQVAVTGASPTLTELLTFVNMSGISGLTVTAPAPAAIIGMSNVPLVGYVNYWPNTVLQATNVGFRSAAGAPLALPNPAAGSILANSIGNAAAWTGVLLSSPGNIPGVYNVFIQK